MSLGPAGASLNPEQAENFEDVRHPADRYKGWLLTLPRWKSNSLSRVRFGNASRPASIS